MLMIRLQRVGKKSQAYFRLVLTEHTKKSQGQYKELLGSYDPHKNSMQTKADRISYWLSNGAQMSATANNLLLANKVIDAKKYSKVTVWRPKVKKAQA